MPSSSYYTDRFHRVYVEQAVADSAYLKRALALLPGIPVHTIEDKEQIPPEHLERHTLLAARPRGKSVTRCPGSRGHLCCNYLTVDLYLGCTLGCGYCIMEGYLNFSPLTVYLQPQRSIARLEEIARRNPGRTIRCGTGEVGDSLQLDPLFGLSEPFIRALAAYPNVFFELKTKTHFVDHLLGIEPKGNAVIGFSLNPQSHINAFEPGASSLRERLAAAERSQQAGYALAFHFDPVFYSQDWESEYLSLVRQLDRFDPRRIAWISLGTMRYTAALKQSLGERQFLYEEFVPCRDGKFRYLQKTRAAIYRTLYRELRERLAAPVYMCMESPAIWREVFGDLPGKIGGLRAIFGRARRV